MSLTLNENTILLILHILLRNFFLKRSVSSKMYKMVKFHIFGFIMVMWEMEMIYSQMLDLC